MDENLRPDLREREGGRSADTTRRSGYQRGFS
jgi:hypothetical protein